MDTKLYRELEEALDTLRDATVNRDYTRAEKLKAVILDFLEPAGFTLVDDPKKVYVIKKIVNVN